MALENYFATLKHELGVSNFTLVQDSAVRRTCPPPKKQNDPQQALRNALRTSATKFSIDECDEPLYCPTRQQSSEISSQSLSSMSTDSLEALVSVDDSYRSSATKNQVAIEKGADSRWASSALQKNRDYPMHSHVSAGIRTPVWRSTLTSSSR